MADTLIDIKRKVDEGVKIARESTDDIELHAVIDDIEEAFNYFMTMVVAFSVGIYAFKFRNEDQIIEQLERWKTAIANGGHARMMRDIKGKVC